MLRGADLIHGRHQPVITDQYRYRRSHETVECRKTAPAIAFVSHIIMQESGVVQKFGCRRDPDTVFGKHGITAAGFCYQK